MLRNLGGGGEGRARVSRQRRRQWVACMHGWGNGTGGESRQRPDPWQRRAMGEGSGGGGGDWRMPPFLVFVSRLFFRRTSHRPAITS